MRLVYFAWVRERIGVSEEEVSPPPHVTTIGDLIDWMADRSEAHASAFVDRGRLRAARDQNFVPLDSALDGATEIAIFPPVTGG
jgi:molybdopterin synthase sulfur carrier subunit